MHRDLIAVLALAIYSPSVALPSVPVCLVDSSAFSYRFGRSQRPSRGLERLELALHHFPSFDFRFSNYFKNTSTRVGPGVLAIFAPLVLSLTLVCPGQVNTCQKSSPNFYRCEAAAESWWKSPIRKINFLPELVYRASR